MCSRELSEPVIVIRRVRTPQELQKTKHHETSQQLSIPKNWMIGCCGNSAVSRLATKVSPMLFNRLGPWGKAMAKYSWMICMICMVLQHSNDGCVIAASSVLLACIIVPTFLSQIGPKSWCKRYAGHCWRELSVSPRRFEQPPGRQIQRWSVTPKHLARFQHSPTVWMLALLAQIASAASYMNPS